ncbi:MAG TPA: FkbM family methyltransferase [Lacibacter sp.]|mgnify:CR=1 FL=1|nr:FkbM family methyltransferase [Lacibacter sp.]HMO90261.1 FkbM family methyltransferase [Lacibacter sp.]HMP87213.1 FkbM family methyltransferase [Lacibacter sp.]
MLRKLGYSIIQLILLIRNYGFSTAFSLWAQLFFYPGSTARVRSRLFRNPVRLRKTDSDIEIFNQVFAERQYQWPGIMELQPRVIVDAGANIGLAALYFARLFPDARICCVEPDAGNLALLQENTRNYPTISNLHGAVWNTSAYLEINNPEGFSAGRSLQNAAGNTSIQGYTVPEIMQHFGVEQIDILKMDIEGAEKEIFGEGDTSWLNKVRILVIELHDMYRVGTARAFFRVMQHKFSRLYVQGENLVCYLEPEAF